MLRKIIPTGTGLSALQNDFIGVDISTGFKYGLMRIFKIINNYIMCINDIGGFDTKLKKYRKNGFITEKQENILKFLINAGNASAHRAFTPSKEVAEALIDTIELMVKKQIVDKKATEYSPQIPKRM